METGDGQGAEYGGVKWTNITTLQQENRASKMQSKRWQVMLTNDDCISDWRNGA